MSIITTRTEHVNAINDHIQQRRLDTGELDPATLTQVHDAWVMAGDVVATRRNERRLRTSVGEPVRNRERWTATATDTVEEGDVTVTRLDGHGTITLPRDYVRQHMQLAYATTEPGAQGDTSHRSLTLATNATTRRCLYMAMTRGQRENLALVVTNTHDLADARAVPRIWRHRHDAGSTSSTTASTITTVWTRLVGCSTSSTISKASPATPGASAGPSTNGSTGPNGRNLDNAALVEIAATLADHEDRPGINQLAAPLTQWTQRRGLELQSPTRPTPNRSSMGIEIDFWENASSHPQSSDHAVGRSGSEVQHFAGGAARRRAFRTGIIARVPATD